MSIKAPLQAYFEYKSLRLTQCNPGRLYLDGAFSASISLEQYPEATKFKLYPEKNCIAWVKLPALMRDPVKSEETGVYLFQPQQTYSLFIARFDLDGQLQIEEIKGNWSYEYPETYRSIEYVDFVFIGSKEFSLLFLIKTDTEILLYVPVIDIAKSPDGITDHLYAECTFGEPKNIVYDSFNNGAIRKIKYNAISDTGKKHPVEIIIT